MPRKGSVYTNVQFTQETKDRLKKEARKRAVSVNKLVELLVEDGLDCLIPVEELQITYRSRNRI